MAGNSQRRGAVRKQGKGMGPQGKTAGSGGRVRRGLEGKGPTPKAEDRVYHRAYREKQARLRHANAGRSTAARSSGSRSGGSGRGAGDWVVGRNPVLEALTAGVPVQAAYVAEGAERDSRLKEILAYAAEHSISLLETTRGELDRLTGGAVHQGVALAIPPFDYADVEDVIEDAVTNSGLLVACDQVTDPHNLGAIIRSAAAFGADGVIVPERRSAHVTPAAWKASAGAAARVPVAKAGNLNRALEQGQAAGFTILGLDGGGEATIAEAAQEGVPVILVVGSEGRGLSRLVREHCDEIVRIPIAAAMESLNASVAVGIALYELSRVGGDGEAETARFHQ
ncbi:MAG: 23S rRNA (guanosine(2251)-2'-O)-methyltransferase RlmB [Propionibacteriaceae bacterium]|jgi:23S rRNA (guanosine2251-2'-O)-methyltransferase|nr:23S rRNA (guanosine(2251)-2'-O)-methyltransferase RlmB [Propionibacteriaceae bacterium]